MNAATLIVISGTLLGVAINLWDAMQAPGHRGTGWTGELLCGSVAAFSSRPCGSPTDGLTTMNGYVVLTHAPASFSDVFYATAATVIPVLFLAIAVQGQMYGDLLKAARRASLRADRGVRSIGSIGMGLAFVAWFATWSLALFLLIVGTYGELAALTALYEQHAESGVFLSTVTLVVAVAIAPASALGRFLYREARGPESRASADSATKPLSTESAPAPGESAPLEPGEPVT